MASRSLRGALVARQPDEARHFLVAQLPQRRQHAGRLLPRIEVFVGGDAVDLDQVHAVGAQAFEALLDAAQRAVVACGRRSWWPGKPRWRRRARTWP